LGGVAAVRVLGLALRALVRHTAATIGELMAARVRADAGRARRQSLRGFPQNANGTRLSRSRDRWVP
jgi:hypothetical protein